MAALVKVSITISQPTRRVWELLMDPRNLQHWLTGFISLTHLAGKPGETGSTSSLKFMERGKEIEVLERILLVKPNEQYNFRMEHQSFEAETDIRLVSIGSQTELIQTVQFFPKSFLMKILFPFVKGQMRKETAAPLFKLKSFIEMTSNEHAHETK